MSSSFTNQPSPRNPRHEDSFTPTPPAPQRGEDTDEDLVPEGRKKLGSLAQKARGNQLKQVRIILFIIGILTIIANIVDIVVSRSTLQEQAQTQLQQQGGFGRGGVNQAAIQQQADYTFMIVCAIDGAFLLTGVIFLVFATIIYRFPVPVTILSLLLYILTWAIGIAIAFAINPIAAASVAGSGIIFRIIFIVILAKSIQSAFAYEKERREAEEYRFHGEMS